MHGAIIQRRCAVFLRSSPGPRLQVRPEPSRSWLNYANRTASLPSAHGHPRLRPLVVTAAASKHRCGPAWFAKTCDQNTLVVSEEGELGLTSCMIGPSDELESKARIGLLPRLGDTE